MAGKEFEEIQSHHAGRRLNLLKSFKEVSGGIPLPISILQNKVGKENVHSFETIKNYTEHVLEKGSESDRLAAQETINNLVPFSVVNHRGIQETVYVEKGIINPNSDKKKVVNPNDDQNTGAGIQQQVKPDANSVVGQQSQAMNGVKTPADHAKETSSDDLKNYLSENPDGEHAEHAKNELAARGESHEGEDTDSVDYSDPDAVKFALDSRDDKEDIINMSIQNGITVAQAMKLKETSDVDHSDTHEKIDAAQAALDALKENTGHPDASGEEGEDSMDDSEDDDEFDEEGDEDDDFDSEDDEDEDEESDEDESEEEGDEDEEEDESEDEEEDSDSNDDMIDEHERLVKTLKSPSKEDDKKEAKVQQKELDEYKKKKK